MQPQQRSIAESIAIAFASSQWCVPDMIAAARHLFRRKQPWIPDLAARIRQRHFDCPRLETLSRAIATDQQFRIAVKQFNLKSANLAGLLGKRSVASVQWPLPRFGHPAELASHFGCTVRQLYWLAALDGHPDFRPRHYVCKWIKKRSDGYRLIESPKPKLKAVQRQILDDILEHIPVHDSAHGFCRRRNVISFVEPHIGRPFCIRMDLRNFFPSVTAKRVCGLYRSAGFPDDVAWILTGLCTVQTRLDCLSQESTCSLRGPSKVRPSDSHSPYLTRHLPQGAPTSPSLANRIAFKLDCRLSALANDADLRYTRYADDLLFSGNHRNHRSAKRFAASVGAIAIEEGFEVNYRKTRFQPAAQRQFAAGIVLNQTTNLQRKQYDQLKAILHNCLIHGPSSQNLEHRNDFRAYLQGKINWVVQLNPSRGEKLRTVFQQINWP